MLHKRRGGFSGRCGMAERGQRYQGAGRQRRGVCGGGPRVAGPKRGHKNHKKRRGLVPLQYVNTGFPPKMRSPFSLRGTFLRLQRV